MSIDINKTISPGSLNDFIAKVDMSKANGGYYSKKIPIEEFITLGIRPILKALPNKLNYADMGGGQGQLTTSISKFLRDHNKVVSTVLVDANPNYLEKGRLEGLITIKCNLEHNMVNGFELITMRGVNHYNPKKTQAIIFNNVYNSLNDHGYFISTICSGEKEDCQLKSDIINHKSLGRVIDDNYVHATCPEEYMSLLSDAGFIKVAVLGFCEEQAFHPTDVWVRSNTWLIDKAINNNDAQAINEIKEREYDFYKNADTLVSLYVTSVLKQKPPKDRETLYKLIPNTKYPVIHAEKC